MCMSGLGKCGENMAKNSYVYFCSECGYESSKWMGQCPGCKAWNTFVEEKVTTSSKGKSTKTGSFVDTGKSPYTLSEISTEEEERLQIGIGELDRVLGGGIVKVLWCWLAVIPVSVNPPCCYRYASTFQMQSMRCCMYRERNLCARSKCVPFVSVL